jgi:hypothetical protein
VDVALTPFPRPGADAFDGSVEREHRARVQAALDAALGAEVCVQALAGGSSAIFVTLENAGAGHAFPSGAAQDRRAWVQLSAYRGEELLFRSGHPAPDEPVVELVDDDTWLFLDRMFDANDNPVTLFWNAERIESNLIPAPTTFDPASREFLSNHVTRRYPLSRDESLPAVPDRVAVLVRVRPMGLEILEDLRRSGHLDAEVIRAMPTHDIVPNRHLADHPELSRLAELTIEWSASVKSSGLFGTRVLRDEAFAKDCVSSIQFSR